MSPHKVSPPSASPTLQAVEEATATNTQNDSHKNISNADKPQITPSLPQLDPCLSYWHRTTCGFKYLNSNANNALPKSSKYVIIGSGLSGALTAFSLLESPEISPSDIVIIEARSAVSGASGRNAGHVRPDAFRGFTGYANLHGAEQALKIIANEKLVFERVAAFVKTHDVPCDSHETTTFDVCLTDEFAQYEAKSLKAFVEAGGDASHVKFWDSDGARERTRVPIAKSAYEWAAGSIHPAKLTQWLLTSVLDRGARLWTQAPVVGIEPAEEKTEHRWRVQTARGDVLAEKVVHCTNAFAAALLPQLQNFVTPNKAQAHSLVPSSAFSGDRILGSTMSLRYSMHHFYSLVQRRGDGTFILGVSRANPELSDTTKAQIVSFDDSHFNQEIVDDALKQFGILFPQDSAKERHGEGLDHAWTGVIAMTPDSVPMVGAIDELPGQYICAGFNGHGMARIFTCAPGLAKLMLGESWSVTGLPECFEYSTARLHQTKRKKQQDSVW